MLAQSSTQLDRWTPREREVATLIAAGMRQREIAGQLGISGDTVRVLAKRAAAKLPGEGLPVVKIARFSHLIATSDSL